jgi:hypothetical protein
VDARGEGSMVRPGAIGDREHDLGERGRERAVEQVADREPSRPTRASWMSLALLTQPVVDGLLR